jgi:hypothetical protein
MDADEDQLIEHADVPGWTLVQRENDLGQLVWVWRPAQGDLPCPEFLTRRQALEFMRLMDRRPELSSPTHGSPNRPSGVTGQRPRQRRTDLDPYDDSPHVA